MPLKRLLDKVKGLRRGAVVRDELPLEAMRDQTKVRVLFVCMGNICRSPTARGVFEKLVQEAGLAHAIVVDSAGTHTYHIGKPPDQRAMVAGRRRGYDLSKGRARRIEPDDFSKFDYILAMDYENLRGMQEMAADHRGKLKLLMDFARTPGQPEVPDPYYGGGGGFERVLDLVEDAGRGLLAHIRAQHRL